MPEIEITSEQEDRLRALQEDIASDVVGKYGHVRPCDAVEFLLDRYDEEGDSAADGTRAQVVDDEASDGDGETETDDGAADDTDESDAGDGGSASDPEGDDDAMLDEMMSLLETHDDKWGESSGDERYAVELPDDSTEHVRTKDDVKALLFKHYR